MFSLGAFALFLSTSTLTSIPVHHTSPIQLNVNAHVSTEEIEYARKIETYLKNNLPGSDLTYRDILSMIIKEGHNVWLSGGAVRDLLGDDGDVPKDVDFYYDCTPEKLEEILIENNVFYTRTPGRMPTHIGYMDGLQMEGSESRYGVHAKDYEQEFTVNTIHYHVNTAKFEPRYKEGIKDLKEKKIVVKEKNLNEWLYGSLDSSNFLVEPSYKIFRFWKMRGKGYRADAHLEHFVISEAVKSFKKNPELFQKALLHYMGKHFASFDQVSKGCAMTMGNSWCEDHFNSLYMHAKKLDQVNMETWNKLAVKAMLAQVLHKREIERSQKGRFRETPFILKKSS